MICTWHRSVRGLPPPSPPPEWICQRKCARSLVFLKHSRPRAWSNIYTNSRSLTIVKFIGRKKLRSQPLTLCVTLVGQLACRTRWCSVLCNVLAVVRNEFLPTERVALLAAEVVVPRINGSTELWLSARHKSPDLPEQIYFKTALYEQVTLRFSPGNLPGWAAINRPCIATVREIENLAESVFLR